MFCFFSAGPNLEAMTFAHFTSSSSSSSSYSTMFPRKLHSATPMVTREKPSIKERETHLLSRSKLPFYLFIFLSLWFSLLFFRLPTKNTGTSQGPLHANTQALSSPSIPQRKCHGDYRVYMYDLPEKFNGNLVRTCENLSVYTNMCPHVANRGLGQPLDGMGPNWYATHQFIAEMIFHARVERHPCRTWEPGEATVFYVPFYGGLHASSKFREPDLMLRDKLAVELVEYLAARPMWQRSGGGDHFLALGRTAWDFMREDKGDDFGANRLLQMPAVANMSVLTVERHPWKGVNQYGIPYASYFHPMGLDEMITWQDSMRRADRTHLYAFVGATRTGVEKAAVRDVILRLCSKSVRCGKLNCGRGPSDCHKPDRVIGVLSQSRFCMQPPGDSFTRRSVFDSMLTGCIPVFFSPHTAYSQYGWYLPAEPSEYSIYIPEGKAEQLEEELLKIPESEVARMRSVVIDLIPAITYAHPNATDIGFRDAIDIAIASLAKHVRSKSWVA